MADPDSKITSVKSGMALISELRRLHLLRTGSEVEEQPARVPTGLADLDRLCAGGLPRGRISEVIAPCCGGATVLYSVLAKATSRGEAAALVDPGDGFDPHSAAAAGVLLSRLLWVRPQSEKQAWRAAELILQAGGFGFVAIDLGVRQKKSAPIPSAVWMRLRKRASDSRSVLLVLSNAGVVGSLAALAVWVRLEKAHWQGRKESWLEKITLSFELIKNRGEESS